MKKKGFFVGCTVATGALFFFAMLTLPVLMNYDDLTANQKDLLKWTGLLVFGGLLFAILMLFIWAGLNRVLGLWPKPRDSDEES